LLFSERGREGSLCGNCSASARQRALLYVLGVLLNEDPRPVAEWAVRPDISLLEAAGRGAYPILLAEKLRYVNTEYRPDPGGELPPFSPYADLERLTYSDGSLDYVLAADVFEHVRHDAAAFLEIRRVLKPGGALVFTVPYDAERAETLQRVQVDGDRDVLLMEPEYHGGGGQSLAYRTYGRDLAELLRISGFSVGLLTVDHPEHGIAGQPVFVAVNAASIDLSRFHRLAGSSPSAAGSVTPFVVFRLMLLLRRNVRAARQIATELRSRFTR
jgi:SAM-dependent methyltransferase